LVSKGDALIGNSDPDSPTTSLTRPTPASTDCCLSKSGAIELFEYAQLALEERRLTPTKRRLTALLAQRRTVTRSRRTLKNFFALMVAAGNEPRDTP